jgi:hypothetical protein
VKTKAALICGGAKSVFEDIEQSKFLFEPDAVFAINDVLAQIPHVDFFVSMHPSKAPAWLKARRQNGYPDPKSYWTAKDKTPPRGMRFETSPNTRGGSGLLAVFVARSMGYTKIVLAGIPLTIEGAHFHDARPWKECLLYRAVWERMNGLKVDVRSMSGWTREYFGYPEFDWLNC